MADLAPVSEKETVDSKDGECESIWLVTGPPFDQRDYMISPSESQSSAHTNRSVTLQKEQQSGSCKIKVNDKYILDSHGALKKLVELVRSGCTQLFIKRIKSLISKYLQGCICGYMIDDIPLIVEVVEYFSRNRDSCPEFSDFVGDLMCPSKNPPIIQKSSDILRSKKILVDYFTVLGELLASFEHECFQNRFLDVIESLITRRKLSDVAAVKLSICQEAMEDSELPYVIAMLMETVPHSLYLRYLDVAVQIILVSLKAGYVMLDCNILNFAVWRLNFCGPYSLASELPKNTEEEALLNEYYTLLEKSSYLIWGLLTIICKCDLNVPCPSEEALVSLRIVFERESTKKSQKAVDTRNNLAGLIVKLCAAFGGDKLAVMESGLAVDIAVMAVATEVGAQGTWMESCNLGTKKEDYILKKLMLLGCCLINKNDKVIEAIKSLNVIDGILLLIDPKNSWRWIPSQYMDLFYVALRTLSELVPTLPEVFVLNNGNTRFLRVVKWCMEKHFDRESLLQILKAYFVIVTCDKNESIINDILAQNGVEFIVELCFYVLGLEAMKLEDQEKLSMMFVILERLLKNKHKILPKYGEMCASVAVALLERVLNDSNCDSKWNPKLLISCGGFMWETIAWCESSLQIFTEKNGIFLILDLIQVSAFPVQMLFLGILVDMTHEGKCISHLITWRGKDGYGVLDLLISIWRREETFTKVQRTPEGLIHDIHIPLMTEEQWYITHQIRGSHLYSPSVAEMTCSARPKIHALYKFLQQRYLDLTKKSESCYDLYFKRVRPSFRVYIPLIEHFLTLKLGEVWFEVLRDTTISGIMPTALDGDIMGILIDEKNKWASRIKTMQEEIILLERMNDSEKENQLYELLISNQFTNSLKALEELDFVARTSNRHFQLQKKIKQIRDVENSLDALSIPPDAHIHRTFMFKTNTTCFCGSYVRIISEKEVVEHDDISIISTDAPEDNCFETKDD